MVRKGFPDLPWDLVTVKNKFEDYCRMEDTIINSTGKFLLQQMNYFVR